MSQNCSVLKIFKTMFRMTWSEEISKKSHRTTNIFGFNNTIQSEKHIHTSKKRIRKRIDQFEVLSLQFWMTLLQISLSICDFNTARPTDSDTSYCWNYVTAQTIVRSGILFKTISDWMFLWGIRSDDSIMVQFIVIVAPLVEVVNQQIILASFLSPLQAETVWWGILDGKQLIREK